MKILLLVLVHHRDTSSPIAVAPSTKVGLVAVEGIDIQRKFRRWRIATREREFGRARRRRCNLYRMRG
jgi:hypothetical protein